MLDRSVAKIKGLSTRLDMRTIGVPSYSNIPVLLVVMSSNTPTHMKWTPDMYIIITQQHSQDKFWFDRIVSCC